MTKQQKIERLARFVGGVRLGFRINDKRWVVTSPVDKGASRLFDPYTRLDDAFMVAEKIVGPAEVKFILEAHGDTNAPGRWWAYFDRTCLGGRDIHGYGHEPAEAIALAADAYLEVTGFEMEHEKGKP